MENSMSKNLCSADSKGKIVENSPEESSWTFYFEDFLCDNYNDNDDVDYDQQTNCNNSMVSDAESSAVKKVGDNGFCWDTNCKKLSFKKRKTKGAIVVDDALEDTASSPVNSPKVGYFNQPDTNRKEKEIMDISQEKGDICGVLPADERSHKFGIDGGDGDHTELKKRGLCLVPLSTLANYFA
ncbi:hypothetical protein LguiB_003048 [Lonicera macranthoides]